MLALFDSASGRRLMRTDELEAEWQASRAEVARLSAELAQLRGAGGA